MITESDLQKVALELGVETQMLKAVVLTECGSLSGNLSSGKPKILFEGHWFYKLIKNKYGSNTAQRYHELYPTLCYQNFTTKYYLSGEKEYTRYEQAYSLEPEIAPQCTSWGLGQIMGFNYQACGCSSVGEFVAKNQESEYEQLNLWIQYLKSQKLIQVLIDKDFEKFARVYNGSAQVEYYANKMKGYYETA